MTRQEIERDYKLRDGMIRTPGKFEGEMLYVPFYWDSGLMGCASHDVNGVWFFEILTDEKQMFPELADYYGIALEESDSGFVTATLFQSAEGYERSITRMEQEESNDNS